MNSSTPLISPGVALAVVSAALLLTSCGTRTGSRVEESFDGGAVPATITSLGAATLEVGAAGLEVRTQGGSGGFRWLPGIEGIVCSRLEDVEIPASEVGSSYEMRWIARDQAGNEFVAANVEVTHVANSVTARGQVTKDGRKVSFSETFNDLEPTDIKRQRIDYVTRDGKTFFYVEIIDKNDKLHLVGPLDPALPNVFAVEVATDLPLLVVGGLEADIVHHEEDEDQDGTITPFDNCPQHSNPGQEDGDHDGQGDACDPCPSVAWTTDEGLERLPELVPPYAAQLAELGRLPLPDKDALCDPLAPLPRILDLEEGAVVSGALLVRVQDLLPGILNGGDPAAPFDPLPFAAGSDVETTVLEVSTAETGFEELDRVFGLDLDDSAQFLWDTEALPAGAYTLRARMIDAHGNRGTAQVTVRVEHPPEARLRIELLTREADVVTLRLDGSESSSPQGSLVKTRWILPGGVEMLSPVVEAEMRPATDDTIIVLEVTDDHGLTGVTTARIPREEIYGGEREPPFELTLGRPFCECVEIDVRDSGDTSAQVAFFENEKLLEAGKTKRSLGSNAHKKADGSYDRMRMNFEVLAKLKAGSTAALCPEQQQTSATVRYLGMDFVAADVGADAGGVRYAEARRKAATPAAKQYPYDPNRLIQDSKHGYKREVASIKDHDETVAPPTIRWSDAPGTSNVPKTSIDGDPGDGFKFEAAFLAVVERCRCTFQVIMEVDKDGNLTTAPAIREELCTF